jgi:hypothetical protein
MAEQTATFSKIVIYCSMSEGPSTSNKLEANGAGKSEIKFMGCAVHGASLNTDNEYVENAPVANCTVKTGSEPAGTIKTNPLTTTLVWNESTIPADQKIIDLFAPVTGTVFIEMTISGTGCPTGWSSATPYKVVGSVLAYCAGRVNRLALQYALGFHTINESSKIEPLFKRWKVKLGMVESSGESKMELSGITPLIKVTLEGETMGLELAPAGGMRGTLGVYE